MTTSKTTVLFGAVLTVWSMTVATATELQLVAGAGIAVPLNEIAAQFERAAGHKIVIRYGTAPELVKMLDLGGAASDLAVVPAEVMTDASVRARVTPMSIRDVARVGIGIAVRAGAPKPDISTVEATKRTLTTAKSVASIPASATGAQLAAMYERLGIAEHMKAKTKAQPTPRQVVEALADGEAEIAVFILNVLIDSRLDIVGPLPEELQREIVYTAGVVADSKQADAANAFIAYLTSPEGNAVLAAKGMNPGSSGGPSIIRDHRSDAWRYSNEPN